MDDENLYEILNVKPTASSDEIKAAFRKLAQIYHPDKNRNSKDSHIRFQVLLNAYQTLADTASRNQYDTYLNTSSVIKKKFKTSGKRQSPGKSISVEYFNNQLNYILWEIEDILSFLRAHTDENKEVNGKTLKEWLLEILEFIEEWILVPCGLPDYFYEARHINKMEVNKKIGRANDNDDHVPYINVEDYFYEIRKRMNKFIDSNSTELLSRDTSGYPVKIADNIIEAMLLSYHYLGSINKYLQDGTATINKYMHMNSIYEKDQKKFLP